MTTQWTLTLNEYDENDMPQHETLATCDSTSQMIDEILKRHDIAYKCFVTEWNNAEMNAYGCGDIAEQINAQEWLEDELKDCAPMPKNEPSKPQPTKKHPVKRVPLGNGEFSESDYEYRGIIIRRYDDIPNGYGGRWRIGKMDFVTRKECVEWIDERIAQKKKETA